MRFLVAVTLISLLAACRSPDHPRAMTVDIDGRILVMESAGPGRIAVAVYEDGRIRGPAELQPDSVIMNGLSEGLELVPHPRLHEWQSLANELEGLAKSPTAGLEDLLNVSLKLPFPEVVGSALRTWAGDDAQRAAAVLDVAAGVEIGGATLSGLVRQAARIPDLEDGRLASWAATPEALEASEVALLLAQHPRSGPYTLGAILRRLDEVPVRDRQAVFAAAAARLAHDEAQAEALVAALDSLKVSERTGVTLELLRHPDAAPALGGEVLHAIDEFYGDERLRVYDAAARLALGAPGARRHVIAGLDDLYGDDRKSMTLRLLEAGLDVSLTSELVAQVDDLFFGDEREEVLSAIISSRGFQGPVQSLAVVQAAEELYGKSRERVLRRILEEPATAAETSRLARLQLARE